MSNQEETTTDVALVDESSEITISVDRDVIDADQVERYEKLLIVCDRNVNLDGRSRNHNSDFCLIKDKKGGEHIEPTRDFCLKAISVFGCNYEPVGQAVIVDDGKHKLITRDVKVSLGDRYIIETGGCSTQESASSGARAFHDALSRAMTRGMKRALEALIGLPFVNMMIKELFGRYNVQESTGTTTTTTPPRTITKPEKGDYSQPVRALGNKLHAQLKSAATNGLITNKERDQFWNRVLLAMGDFNQLKAEERNIEALLEERQA